MSEESAARELSKSPLFHWKPFFLFFTFSISLVAYWHYTSSLFQVPEDVLFSRKQFFTAKEHYLTNKSYWDAKMLHIVESIQNELRLGGNQSILHYSQELPEEVLISFLTSYLNLKHLDTFSLFPKGEGSSFFVFSKPESGAWPFSVILSLETEVRFSQNNFSIHFLRLRKGSQDIGLSLAWAYFGSELERLRDIPFVSLEMR